MGDDGFFAAMAREAILKTRKYKQASTHALTNLDKTAVVQIETFSRLTGISQEGHFIFQGIFLSKHIKASKGNSV